MLGTVARRQTLEHGPSRVGTQRRRGTANVLGPRSADKPLETLCNSRVEIVSEEPAPPISLFPVTVHYLESGGQKDRYHPDEMPRLFRRYSCLNRPGSSTGRFQASDRAEVSSRRSAPCLSYGEGR